MKYWGGSNSYNVPPISQISSYKAYEKLKNLWCDGNRRHFGRYFVKVKDASKSSFWIV